MIRMPDKARANLMENIDRLRILSEDWQLGDGGFADDIRDLGEKLASDGTYTNPTSQRDVRRIFDIIGHLLDDVAQLGGAGVMDPDYDGPDEVESGPPRDAQREAAQDADR